MDAAPVPGHDELPKRRVGERRARTPDLSSNWWISLAGEEQLASRLSEVLAHAEAGVERDGESARPASPEPTPPDATLTPSVSIFGTRIDRLPPESADGS